MYFTTFNGGENVHSVTYTYNGASTFTLGSVMNIAATPGADGIVFTSDGQLAIGGQGSAVYKVNPVGGSFTSESSGGTSAYHMMAAPDGTIYSSGIPGTPASYNSTLTVAGTAHPVSGSDTVLDTIIWDTKNGKAYYTSSGSGGSGDFGEINLTTWTTTVLHTGVPAAHGGYYDPFSDTIILQGDGHITQFDPNTAGVPQIGDITGLGGTFDQGTIDGKGHIFAANNDGNLTFIDYSATKNISTASFVDTTFLAGSLDDVAPLSGAGSQVPDSLDSVTIAIWFAGFLGFCGWKQRRVAAAKVC
jgi:hypothetical protein